MNYRLLGKTGLQVSALSLGTVSLGVDYGINVPSEFGRPDKKDSVRLLRQAADEGINLFDTAPNYGESERLLGEAIGKNGSCYFATKVSVPRSESGAVLTGADLQRQLSGSVEKSLSALRRDVLDIVQIHNATEELIQHGEMTGSLLGLQKQGKICFLGASVYTEQEALAVIRDGNFSVLLVAYNLLDQRMAKNIFPQSKQEGVGILNRSVFLKGVLTAKAQWLPAELKELQRAAGQAKNILAGGTWQKLPEAALRFCLSSQHVSSVLVGVRTADELQKALQALEQGGIGTEELSLANGLALHNEQLLNPANWPVA